jgi:hypothetical protein
MDEQGGINGNETAPPISSPLALGRMVIDRWYVEDPVAIPREMPYIWATWLSRVMSGNVSRQWQYWFLAQNKLVEEQPATFDSIGS